MLLLAFISPPSLPRNLQVQGSRSLSCHFKPCISRPVSGAAQPTSAGLVKLHEAELLQTTPMGGARGALCNAPGGWAAGLERAGGGGAG